MLSTSSRENLAGPDLVGVATDALPLLDLVGASLGIETDRASGQGEVVVIGVVVGLLGRSVVALPDLATDSVARVETIVDTEVGVDEPDGVLTTLNVPHLVGVLGGVTGFTLLIGTDR